VDKDQWALNRVQDDTRPIVEAIDLEKCYGDGIKTWALRGIDFRIDPGEFLAIVGASGSGKSTLLNVVGALDRQSSGKILIDGVDTSTLDDPGLAALRGDTIGFVFQFHYLLAEFTVLENALMPQWIRGKTVDTKWIRALLGRVGLADRLNSRPGELSGGQQQRVAIVRALANRPKLILADEPTGNLDSQNGALVFDLLTELNEELGIAFMLVTHDDRLAQRARRIVAMGDGHIVADYQVDQVEEEARKVAAGIG